MNKALIPQWQLYGGLSFGVPLSHVKLCWGVRVQGVANTRQRWRGGVDCEGRRAVNSCDVGGGRKTGRMKGWRERSRQEEGKKVKSRQ